MPGSIIWYENGDKCNFSSVPLYLRLLMLMVDGMVTLAIKSNRNGVTLKVLVVINRSVGENMR